MDSVNGDLYKQIENVVFPKHAGKEAFSGIAGDVTNIMCDGTELCPEAVLAQFLCIFGNMLGRSLYKHQESRHGAVLNVAIVGSTAEGGKGGALSRVKELIRAVEIKFHDRKLSAGHNSAEALLEEICDAVTSIKKGKIVISAENVSDKRLVIVEEELSRLFQIGKREGSTMSETLRQFYDAPEVVAAKSLKSNLKSTQPHVSILGHITPEGLKSSMPTVEAFNGFANRFTYIASKRVGSVSVPPVLNWDSSELQKRVIQLRGLIEDFRPNEACIDNPDCPVDFSTDGRTKWDELYHDLTRRSKGLSGLKGAVIARAKPTLLRLGIIYAALDASNVIEAQHLAAASALWDYSEASAFWAFGQNSGNADGDKILKYLRREGPSTKTDIQENVFKGHKSKSELNEALSHLFNSGLATFEKVGKGETWAAK